MSVKFKPVGDEVRQHVYNLPPKCEVVHAASRSAGMFSTLPGSVLCPEVGAGGIPGFPLLSLPMRSCKKLTDICSSLQDFCSQRTRRQLAMIVASNPEPCTCISPKFRRV